MKFATRATEISPFLAMAYGEKAAQLAATGADVIRLNLGEPDFGAPTPVLDAMKASLDTPDYPYTSALGLPELREAIANFYHKKHGLHVPSSRIVVTAGASAALLLASAALVEPGDNVILGDPSYPCNRRFLNAFGADVTLVPTRSQNNFQLTCNDVKKHWKSNTKGVLIATPANPTGTAICPEELAAIGQICKENNGFLIVDEIYLDLALTPPHQQESAQLHSVLANRNLQDTLIVINSFSKYFGMTGWRLGWSVVPNAMTSIVEKLAQNLFICPSTLSQKAALACFTPGALAQSEENKNTLSVRANIVFNAISTMGLSIDAYPDGAFYAYINISNTELSAIEFCDKLLDTHHVALTPGNDFGEHNASQYVRLSFATEESRLIEGLNRLAQFVASCRK
ncbi:aminotransferase class I/II-fold pyridoxal phosphate-dependent enzyme [Alteromonas sp. B31-7]|uniref:aminotransferase class I/II-fold pyridoxal phosphate-dependent enzyme n=1 Tax=Alteromonas sp. B31-7 TaxID=2785913 RepID=UPI0018C900DC|nr:aminotransferase class I/II-fold pyridoxal phosphate-dependent enzyme [Alteromonas sp. B31-7]QPL51512.1 aminotransferase class I/II-fold pyridoxal phosphate-dependent enzyme [Alteromonas sp. B31-7]